jgi:hypothetical protein
VGFSQKIRFVFLIAKTEWPLYWGTSVSVVRQQLKCHVLFRGHAYFLAKQLCHVLKTILRHVDSMRKGNLSESLSTACVCVCMCVRACARACACVCMYECIMYVCVCMYMCVCVCVCVCPSVIILERDEFG